MDDEVTVIASMQSSYIFDAINISFTPHFADDDNISRRLYNDDCEVSKLWGSTHCHWNPSGPGTVKQSVFGLDHDLWHSFQQSQPFSTVSIQEGLDILDSMLAGTATIEETVIIILEQIFWGKNKKIESYDMNSYRWSGLRTMSHAKALHLTLQKCAGAKWYTF